MILALALRLPHLAQRPMHTDEAVHAIKFGQVLEEHTYQYNPFEYHGPTLIFATLIPAYLQGQYTLVEVTEQTLRLVPALFGAGLILILFAATGFIEKRTLLFIALFTAMSPAFVFYSRYYIMEILLAFFTFTAIIAAFQYVRTRKFLWALLAGISLGLMHATKETCILAWFAMASALFLTYYSDKKHVKEKLQKLQWHTIIAAALAGIFVSMLFMSTFLQNPRGIVDSVLTYKTYIDRGVGGFDSHVHPWNQYFKWLLVNNYEGRPLWTEALIFLLAIPGFFAIFSKRYNHHSNRFFLKFIAFYTLVLTVTYALIPYKTPWSLLGFYHGLIFIAGVGAVALFDWARFRLPKILLAILLSGGIVHLGWQAVQLNFEYDADYSNPYVYAHTHKNIYELVEAIDSITFYSPHGKDTFIEVVCPGDDYWPLPWYLREYTQVGYFSEFDFTKPAAPLIVTMPELESQLLKKLYEIPPPGQRDMYIPHFPSGLWLRHGVEIELFVRKDMWDEWHRQSP